MRSTVKLAAMNAAIASAVVDGGQASGNVSAASSASAAASAGPAMRIERSGTVTDSSRASPRARMG